MTDHKLILHHYEMSPFAQKIRSMFGYCDLVWHSVLSPAMPPRPNLDPLTGGYRKIPVLQIGADLFCDTRLISAEIATLCEQPKLDRNHCGRAVKEFVDKVDSELFLATAGSASPLKSLTALLLQFGPFATLRFIKDRTAMMKKAKVRMAGGAKAQKMLQAHYSQMESMLTESRWLFGEHPSIADFSAYQVAWLAQSTGGKSFALEAKHTQDWYQRITNFGTGRRKEMSPKTAFSRARDASPRELPESSIQHAQLGEQVSIAPADYGLDPVLGKLVAATSERWIVERETDAYGRLHVHFPKQGFDIS